MTLNDLLNMVEGFLAYDLDGYDSRDGTATVADRISAINWAIRTVARRSGVFDPSIPVTLEPDRAVYDIRRFASDGRRIIHPLTVIVNGIPLRDCSGRAFGLWSLTEIERAFPGWRGTIAGVPTKAALAGHHLILHPAPDATAVAAGNHFIGGTYLPKDLTDSDLDVEIPLPVEVHEAVAYCAAVKLATPTVSEQMGMARLQAFSAEWVAAIDELKRETASTLTSWGSTTGSEGGDWLCL